MNRMTGLSGLLLGGAAALFLATASAALAATSDGTVKAEQKISNTVGGFTGMLDNEDRLGISVARLGDLDGDGVSDLAVGALSDDDGGVNRGAVWVLFLNADGTVKAEQKISDTAGGFTGVLDNSDEFGVDVAGLGDLDGDGVPDLAVGAHFDDDGGTSRGAVWVLFLNTDGTVKAHQKISDIAGGFTGSLDNGDRIGFSVGNLGDIDGDGVPDLAVGAPTDDDGGLDRGAVWVLFLNTDGTVKAHQKISDTAGGFTGGLANTDVFGFSAAGLGDLDGDGIPDLAVGATLDNDGGTDRGAVWVLFLNTDGTVKAHQKISDTAGGFTGSLDNSDRFGASVPGLGDLNGDGVIDLAVGAFGDDDGGLDRGAVWVLFLNTDGTVKAEQKISDTAGGFTGGLDSSDLFGFSVTDLGDLDGDGVSELAVGGPLDDDGGTNRGAVWVLFLNPIGIDHVLLYDVRVARDRDDDDDDDNGRPALTVTLADQFDAEGQSRAFEVGKVERLGNPADKNDEGIGDPDTHYVSYRIKRGKGEPKHVRLTDIKVTNQFGEIVLDTKKPDRLLVPSAKDLNDPVPPLDPGAEHFKCYPVTVTGGTPKFEKREVSVVDQFEQPTRLDVRKPARLCNPASKDGSKIGNPDGHLLCYKVKRAKGEPKFAKVEDIHINNQFGPLQLDARKEKELCVPSEKDASEAIPLVDDDDDDDDD